MEALIYLEKCKMPLKKVICKRDNGKYIVENLQFKKVSEFYYNTNFNKFEEINEEAYSKALKTECESITYIKNKIKELNSLISIEESKLKAEYINNDSFYEVEKMKRLKEEIASNENFLKSKKFLSLSEDEKLQVERVQKNKVQLEKAVRRIDARINKKEKEMTYIIKGKITELNEELLLLDSQLRYIKSLKKKEPLNTFFTNV